MNKLLSNQSHSPKIIISRFFLATSSTDRTVKLWNLETFKAVGSTDLVNGSVVMTKFVPETKSLLAATADQIRCYPVNNLHSTPDIYEADWGGTLRDMQVSAGGKVLGISTDASIVNVWVGEMGGNNKVRYWGILFMGDGNWLGGKLFIGKVFGCCEDIRHTG